MFRCWRARAWTTSLTYWTRKRNSRFVERLEEQMRLLFNIPLVANGGATGNYNAHHGSVSTD
jgi:hypothetical protein